MSSTTDSPPAANPLPRRRSPWAGEWTAPRLSGARRAAAGLTAVAALAVAVGLAWYAETPPAAAPADAPADQFSAARAWTHLERIADGGPTPIGSEGNAKVRDHLVGALRDLGLDPEVQTGVGARDFGGDITAGIADNIVATVPGTDSTGTVLLAAHYDSTSTTPGTTDDKASAATIVEIARVLIEGPAQRNDIVLLLSDGEEPGLVGAEAFVAHSPEAGTGEVRGTMINLEGPGNAGPSVVYNISKGDGPVVDLVTGSVAHPAGESALLTGFRDMPKGFNSDRTTVNEHGFTGVDTGFFDGRVYYHHPRDTLEAFNRPSLQMHGDNALAMTRAAAETDLAALKSGSDATFFAAYGAFVHYPNALVWPLAVVGALSVLGLAVFARVRRLASVPRLLLGTAAALLPLVAAGALAVGLWELLTVLRPAYVDFVSDTYRPWFYRWGIGAAVLAAVWLWAALLRRWIGAVALSIGALAWSAVLGLVAAALLPSGSYLGALPAIAGAGAGALALVLRERRPGLAVAALAIGALPGAVLLFLPGRTLLAMFGVSLFLPGTILVALAVLAVVPVLTVASPAPGSPRWRTALAPLVCGALAVALVGTGFAVDRFDAAHPRMAHLVYLLDADTGTARWVSGSEDPHPWAARYASDTADKEIAELPVPDAGVLARSGPADAADLAAPDVEVLDTRRDGDGTEVTLRVRPGRDAYQVGLYSADSVRSAAVTAAGHPRQRLPETDPAEAEENLAEGSWAWSIQFFAPPKDGLEFMLRVDGTHAPRIGVSETTLGLDGMPGYRPRPSGVDVMPSMSALPTDTVTVSRTVRP